MDNFDSGPKLFMDMAGMNLEHVEPTGRAEGDAQEGGQMVPPRNLKEDL